MDNKHPYRNPPKWSLRFFRWFCRPDIVEDIEGDLLERFDRQLKKGNRKSARRGFVWQVISLFRPSIIRSFSFNPFNNRYDMFRHNLLIAWRSARKDKSTFFINLIGLSTGLACALLIFMWVHDEVSVDRFHEKGKNIYQIRENVKQDHGLLTRVTTAGPTAMALATEMPEVEMAVTTLWISEYTLSQDNRDLKADGTYCSKDFFNLFSYPLLEGQPNEVLSDKSSIVISESLAKSLFGTAENIIGSTVEWQHEEVYQVSGIMADVPTHSSKQFDFVLSFEGFVDNNSWVTDWSNTAPRTYILLKENTNLSDFNDKINQLVFNKTNGSSNHREPFATLYADTYLHGNYENGQQAGGRIQYVHLFTLIALFILLIACINFMNLSTAQASKRTKEIGIKKTLGATRFSLISQYLNESILVASISLIVAVVFVWFFLPQFNIITGKEMNISLNLNIISTLVILVIAVGLLAGSYPALYLSKFKPVTILKGRLNNLMGETWARRGLVVFQFSLSIILISAVLVIYRQMIFIQTEHLGYDRENVVVLEREGKTNSSRETFLAAIKEIPGVIDASAIGHGLTGHNGGTYGIEWSGKNPEDRTEFERVAVAYDIIELLDINMVEGRSFSRSFRSDTNKIIFNQAAVEYMGLEEPIGKRVKLWNSDMEIIGVTENFHFASLHEKVKPLFMWLNQNTNKFMIKIAAGQEKATLAQMQDFYQEFNPGYPFNYHFLDEDYQALYDAEQRVSTLAKYFAGLAILISCLGLLGLAIYTAEKRRKEIGIRKILGCGELAIVYLLSSDFTKMVLVAILIAIPVSYFLTASWLEGFAFHINLTWWYFFGAGGIALIIAWLTIGIQTFKAARVNPIDCIHEE